MEGSVLQDISEHW